MNRNLFERQYSDERGGHKPPPPQPDALAALARNYRELLFYREGIGRDTGFADAAINSAVSRLKNLLPQAQQMLAAIETDLIANYSHAHDCPDCGIRWNCLAECEPQPAAQCGNCALNDRLDETAPRFGERKAA